MTQAVALARFERHFGDFVPEPTAWEVFLDWRLTLGVFLLTGLCLFATVRAPENGSS